MQDTEVVREVTGDETAAGNEVAHAPTDEWTAAALAHASVLLALVLGVAGGVGALVGPAVALAVYLGYREKSRFVAFHALQACIYQVAALLLGLPLYVACVIALACGVAIAWAVSGALAVVLVGLLLMPLALLLTLLLVLVVIGAPLAWLGYGLYASYRVYQGYNFRYWLIGDLVAREVKF